MDLQTATVAMIRERCSKAFGLPVGHPFFRLSYMDGEAADDALWRMFVRERPLHTTDAAAVDVLIFG